MNSCWIFYILVPLIALAQFSVHGLPAQDQFEDETTEEDVNSTTVTETTEVQTEESIVDKRNEAVVKAKGGGVVAGNVKRGDAFAIAVDDDENGEASIKLNGKGVISAATGDGEAMSLDTEDTKFTMTRSNNGTAVAAKGSGNATISSDASSGNKSEAKTSVKLEEGKASGSASGKGAASVSNVKGIKNSGSSSAASGNSEAMGAVEDMSDGFGEALGTLTIKGSNGGVASSGSATSGKAATSLSGSDDDNNIENDATEKELKGKKAGALAISTNSE